MNPPSGNQYRIGFDDQEATIVEVGGGIRTFTKSDLNVLDPYGELHMCDGAHGTPLIPWPNRLADGRYDFDGESYQVALTEPTKGNAIHGFLRWRSWTATEHTASSIAMETHLRPMQGYPFNLSVRIDYALGETGLTVTTTATNTGSTSAPYGVGQHPYLSAGPGLVDDCELHLDAATRITTDIPRQLPTGSEPVEGTAYDFRSPRRIGDLPIDHAFTDLLRDPQGRAWVRLLRPDGFTARTWVDNDYPLIQIYTGDTLAPGRQRVGLGTEPMSCPPNAFQSGESVIRLTPGQSVITQWGADLIDR